MDTLKYIADKFNVDITTRPPLQLPISRDTLAVLFGELGFTLGAEVGVERGLYSEVLCKSNPQLKLYSIDAWQPYHDYRLHVSKDKLDGFYEQTKERMAPYNCTLVKAFSVDAAKMFEDGTFDFVYIDANHEFIWIAEDINAWLPKVRSGGIISGHDYLRARDGKYKCHVKDVVQAWAYSHAVSPWFFTHEYCASWFWVVA